MYNIHYECTTVQRVEPRFKVIFFAFFIDFSNFFLLSFQSFLTYKTTKKNAWTIFSFYSTKIIFNVMFVSNEIKAWENKVEDFSSQELRKRDFF